MSLADPIEAGRPAPAPAGASWASQLLAAATASHARALGVLLLISLACFLPGLATLQPMDRDEPRFAQASKQMLETRDFIDIRFQDEARHKKPVGIYWLQSAVVAAGDVLGVPDARRQIALYRIPSQIGAIATVLLTYWALLAFLPARLALLGGALMAASILLGVEARLAKTDAVLAACSVAALGAMARVYLDWRRVLPFAVDERNWLVFWGAVALAVLVKGPILPLVLALTAVLLFAVDRDLGWWRSLRPLHGLGLVLAVAAPWLIAITIKSGGAFFVESVGKDMIGKVAEGQEKHGAPPGFYFLAFFATFWPAAPLAAMAAPFAWTQRRDPRVLFLLAWIVPAWLLFEAVPTKLPHYVLPLYPAVAGILLLALGAGGIDRQRRGSGLVIGLMALIPALLLVGIPGVTWWLDNAIPWLALPALVAGLLFALSAVVAARGGRFEAALWRGVAASVVVSLGFYGFANTSLRSLKLSQRLAETVAASPCPDPQVLTAGYREPSLVFLVGTELRMGSGAEAAQFLAQPGCRIVFVADRERPAFDAEVAARNVTPRLLTRVGGFNLNGGRRLDISVLANGG